MKLDRLKESGPNMLASGAGVTSLIAFGVACILDIEAGDPNLQMVAIVALVTVGALVMWLRSVAHKHNENGTPAEQPYKPDAE